MAKDTEGKAKKPGPLQLSDEERRAAAQAIAAQKGAERRQLLKGSALVGGLSAAAGWAALAPPSWPLSIRDPDGARGKPTPEIFRLPEGGFAVSPSKVASHLGVARGDNVNAMVRAAIDNIGGIKRFVQKGDVVLIKPNVAFDRPAPLGATTNPEVLAAVIETVRAAGASEIRVADNPIESPESCFARSGIQKAAVGAGARVFLPGPHDFRMLNVPGAKWIESWPFFWSPFEGVDKVIGVSPVKDHNLCRASMTTKNWYGLLGGRRNQFHQDIHGIISDLALMLRPTFVILDATRVLFRSGPTGGSLGDVKLGHAIVASTDSLAADAYGWDNLLSRQDEDLPHYFALAGGRGLGNPDWKNVSIKETQAG